MNTEQLMPWQTERDPEKALEKIFDAIADEVFILEEPFDGTFRRKIVFTLNGEFHPQKVYPREYPAEGIVF